jgi:hypothetical protein
MARNTNLLAETILIYVSCGVEIWDPEGRLCGVRFGNSQEEFRHNDNFIAREVVFLDRTPQDFFGEAVGVTLTIAIN